MLQLYDENNLLDHIWGLGWTAANLGLEGKKLAEQKIAPTHVTPWEPYLLSEYFSSGNRRFC